MANYMSAFIRNGIRYIFPDAKLYWLLQRLTADHDVYVDATNGNDALAVIVGGTQENPFQHIQAAVNYVAETYFLGPYNVTIHTAAGIYDEFIDLVDYQTTSGVVAITGDSGPANTTIQNTLITSTSIAVRHIGTTAYYLTNFTILTPTRINGVGLYVVGGEIDVDNCIFTLTPGGGSYAIQNGREGMIRIGAKGGGIGGGFGCTINMQKAGEAFLITGGTFIQDTPLIFNITSSSVVAIHVDNAAYYMNANISVQGGGSLTYFAFVVQTSLFHRQGSILPTILGSISGQRYFGSLNGIINTAGGGPNFFPGTIAGTLASGAQYI